MTYHSRTIKINPLSAWDDEGGYKRGVRDAKNAAAEIAVEADREIEELVRACKMFIEDFDRPLTSMGLRVRGETVDRMRAAIAKREKESATE